MNKLTREIDKHWHKKMKQQHRDPNSVVNTFLKTKKFSRRQEKFKKYVPHIFTGTESDHLAMKFQKELTINATEAELRMKEILDSVGLPYKFQWIFKKYHDFRIADFYVPKHNFVIEVDGYKHFTLDGRKKDRERTKLLCGTHRVKKVYRFSNSFVMRHGEMISLILSRRYIPDFERKEKEILEMDAALKAILS